MIVLELIMFVMNLIFQLIINGGNPNDEEIYVIGILTLNFLLLIAYMM